MKCNTSRAYVVPIVLLVLVSMLSMLPKVLADTTTTGGTTATVEIRETFTIHQGQYLAGATDLHFRLYSDTTIVGWNVTISDFTSSTSLKHDYKSVNVTASGAVIPYCTSITVKATIWTYAHNWLKIDNIRWTTPGEEKIGGPDHGWAVLPPDGTPTGHYNHLITFTNFDSSATFTVTGFTFYANMSRFEDLSTISFPAPLPNFTLAPGQTWSYLIPTAGSFQGGHIYFKYSIVWNGDMVLNATADHPVYREGGGITVPVDKFGILAPYIGLTSTILGVTLAAAIYVKRSKRKK